MRYLGSSRITITGVHTSASAGLLPPHACKQRPWELHLGREEVPWNVLTEIAPPPTVHSVTDHVPPVLMLPDPSRHVDPSAY